MPQLDSLYRKVYLVYVSTGLQTSGYDTDICTAFGKGLLDAS